MHPPTLPALVDITTSATRLPSALRCGSLRMVTTRSSRTAWLRSSVRRRKPKRPHQKPRYGLTLLRYADKAHRWSASRMVKIETCDCASIVDAGRGGLFAFRRIEGCEGSI